MAQITSITYKPQHMRVDPPDHYARVPLQQVTLKVGYGIEGDRKGGHPKRQLNIMAAETLEKLAGSGYQTTPGAMGEQMVVRGLDFDALVPGARLRMGAVAVIEVVGPREGCDRFAHIQQVEEGSTEGLLGIMARVVDGGPIAVGDSVHHV
jgi:MOSC domain-containing protein YiiM